MVSLGATISGGLCARQAQQLVLGHEQLAEAHSSSMNYGQSDYRCNGTLANNPVDGKCWRAAPSARSPRYAPSTTTSAERRVVSAGAPSCWSAAKPLPA